MLTHFKQWLKSYTISINKIILVLHKRLMNKLALWSCEKYWYNQKVWCPSKSCFIKKKRNHLALTHNLTRHRAKGAFINDVKQTGGGVCDFVTLCTSPPAISTVFSFPRILWSIRMRSISNIKCPYFDKIYHNTLSETLMQSLWNWPLLLCFCLCTKITHVSYS